MHTAQEQRLSAVEGADAGEIALIQQGHADFLVGAALEALHGNGGIPLWAEQIRSEMPDRPTFLVGGHHLDDAEPVADGRLPRGRHDGADLSCRPAPPGLAGPKQPPTALHPQMGVQREAPGKPG